MLLKRVLPLILLIVVIGAVFGWKTWKQHSVSDSQALTEVKGPAVILFRGDNDPGCLKVYHLVEQTANHHNSEVQFIQVEWSDKNPLIKKYQIRFLPSVVFVDKNGHEADRIVGESAAVQQKLQQTLASVDDLLLK
jgi:hypothetical protein